MSLRNYLKNQIEDIKNEGHEVLRQLEEFFLVINMVLIDLGITVTLFTYSPEPQILRPILFIKAFVLFGFTIWITQNYLRDV